MVLQSENGTGKEGEERELRVSTRKHKEAVVMDSGYKIGELGGKDCMWRQSDHWDFTDEKSSLSEVQSVAEPVRLRSCAGPYLGTRGGKDGRTEAGRRGIRLEPGGCSHQQCLPVQDIPGLQ